MEIYLVGGAVRDELLNRPVCDRDWVVVGATPEQMLELGYNPVGKDFPVFLHPKTHEEYALARTERKKGHGYKGFTVQSDPGVTLEDDLIRRDLTINAIAKDANGQLIDPYNGQADLEQRYLRHVSPAFTEDPLRVLRVARFAARYHYLGFKVHVETLALMMEIANSGELRHLTAERVWKEWQSALAEPNPEIFFDVMLSCDALILMSPYVASLWQKDSPARKALICAANDKAEGPLRFAALMHTLETPFVDEFCEQYRVPNEYKRLAHICSQIQEFLLHDQLTPHSVLALFKRCDAWRRPEDFKQLLQVIDYIGEAQQRDTSALTTWCWKTLEKTQAVDVQALIQRGLEGKDLGAAITNEKLSIVTEAMPDLNAQLTTS